MITSRITRCIVRPVVIVMLLALADRGAAQISPSGDRFQQRVQPVLAAYCVDCHSGENAEAGMDLEQFNAQADAMKSVRTWGRVLDALEGGFMPPPEAEQPSADDVSHVVGWIEADFLEALRDAAPSLAAVPLRRLNREEYNNTLRDLLGIDSRLGDGFPADNIAFGFDNVGSAQTVSPILIEKYLDAAETALQTAIVAPDVKGKSPAELIGLTTYPLPTDKPVEFAHHLKPGRYLAELSLVRVGTAESVAPPRLQIGLGSQRRTLRAVQVQDETVIYRVWLNVRDGDQAVHVMLAAVQPKPQDAGVAEQVGVNVSGDQRYGGRRGLFVDSMVVRGPVPHVLHDLPESHRNLVTCVPDGNQQDAERCAEQIISSFTERAYRRPVEPHEVEPVMSLFEMAFERGESFERALQVALSSVLVTPQFLFLVEPDAVSEDRPLNANELASRLSYFLWSSMPDEQLLKAASQGTLRENLRPQVERMLQDAKASAFVTNFVGQWLLLRKLQNVAPDQQLFPEFDTPLREAMAQETERFFGVLLNENRSVLEMLDADYVVINERLARHYEISGVTGDHFRKVQVADGRRGGILTQASILTLTSHSKRTSPVKRGQWILQQLLGTPPPPPPPEVAQLDENAKAGESASLRKRLELHRANPECAACHNQMDPLGFALENYDAIGRWRFEDGVFDVDASGELVGGRAFQNARELKAILQQSAAKTFTRCLVENMLTYALGRGLEPHDLYTVEAIRKQLAQDQYRLRTLVVGIVESRPFLYKGSGR